ncbi:hypothetical protein HLY00_4416 [Mycolicibacterium hippocampi]|uniref:Uncharacterized protein n=1 Tax=Mycolicibacterium hippocampi TaxID=659824 RepID=A0A850PUW3_9MYCO|nr:hypothetical protein [Mycolicibacterium hippocampi]
MQRQIADRVHRPHRIGGLGGGLAQGPEQVVVRCLQRAPQVAGLDRRHRHALAVGRIEAHHRVAERDDPLGETLHLVVAAPPAGRVLVHRDRPEGLTLAQRAADVFGKNLVGQRAHLVEIRRRSDLSRAEGRHTPVAVLVEEHPQPDRVLPGRACDHNLLPEQSLGDVHLVGGVIDPHVDGVLARTVEAPLGQPHRETSAPAGGIHDEVGVDGLAVGGPDPGDPVAVEHRLVDGLPDQRHVVDRQGPLPDLPFQVRATRHVGGELVLQRVLGPQQVPGRAEGDAVGPVLQNRHTRGDHVVEQSGKETFELLGAARHQQVHMPALWNRGAIRRHVGQFVALVDRDPVVEIRQHPGSAQPREAGTDHDRVFITLMTHRAFTLAGTFR